MHEYWGGAELAEVRYVQAQQPIIAIGDGKSHRINYSTSNKTHMHIVQYFLHKNDSPLISACQNQGRSVASHVTMSILSNNLNSRGGAEAEEMRSV